MEREIIAEILGFNRPINDNNCLMKIGPDVDKINTPPINMNMPDIIKEVSVTSYRTRIGSSIQPNSKSVNPIIVHDQILEASFLERGTPMKFDLEDTKREIMKLRGTTKDRIERETPEIHRECPVPGEKSPKKNDINKQTNPTTARKIEPIIPQKPNADFSTLNPRSAIIKFLLERKNDEILSVTTETRNPTQAPIRID